MNEFENEVRLIDIKKDPLNPHQHQGIHPYVIIRNYGTCCLVAPCTSKTSKRTLPTQVRIASIWDKETMVLLEQMITVPACIVAKGKFCTKLSEEDIERVHNAAFIQLGIYQDLDKNVMKGSVYYLSLPKSESFHRVSGVRPYIVMSNEACNAHSPVVHVLPMSKTRHSAKDREVFGKANGYALLENITLIPKEMLKDHTYYGELKKGSVYAINKEIEKIIKNEHTYHRR